MSGIGLTPRQAELLRFLGRWPYCPAPTLKEMAVGLGLRASSGAHRIFTGLAERGYVRRECSRETGWHSTIRILREPPQKKPMSAEQGIAFARKWRDEMKPYFDELYGPDPFAPYPKPPHSKLAFLPIHGRIA